MEVWHVWAVLALVFVIIEIFTTGFAVFCLAIGAFVAAIAAACHCGLLGQILWFSVSAFLAFVVARPLLLKGLQNKSKERLSGVDALPGRKATVTQKIDGAKGGLVAVDGDVWKAVAEDGRSIDCGEVVEVIRLQDSVTLVVG